MESSPPAIGHVVDSMSVPLSQQPSPHVGPQVFDCAKFDSAQVCPLPLSWLYASPQLQQRHTSTDGRRPSNWVLGASTLGNRVPARYIARISVVYSEQIVGTASGDGAELTTVGLQVSSMDARQSNMRLDGRPSSVASMQRGHMGALAKGLGSDDDENAETAATSKKARGRRMSGDG